MKWVFFTNALLWFILGITGIAKDNDLCMIGSILMVGVFCILDRLDRLDKK